MPAADHRLRLASHVRACHSQGTVILLDLHRNKYLGVGGIHLPALAAAIDGWPDCPSAEIAAAAPADVSTSMRLLQSHGLLTDQSPDQLPIHTLEEPTTSLNTETEIDGANIGLVRLARFILSAITAATWLRFCSLLTISMALAARRIRLNRISHMATVDELRRAVAAYERLRLFAFTSRDQCLYDSLALVNFLAHEGLVAQWVIGVRTRPFGAHSWVQSAGIVLNDQHEHVRKFHPILVV